MLVELELTYLQEDFALDRQLGVVVGKDVYYFGGLLKGVKRNDMYRFDTKSMMITKLECKVQLD